MFWTEPWFWVFIIGFLVFLVFLIIYEAKRRGDVPTWLYVLGGLSYLIVLVGLVIYIASPGKKEVSVVKPVGRAVELE